MSDIDEKRLFEVKGAICMNLLSAANFGMGNKTFTATQFADLIDELIVMRIKQALDTNQRGNN